ncbi:DUF5667 domain-containing protein [Gandjariella thermophila]|uniref:DUF5667 domain-containing protein n=1 Tax=Gandjariella thermophila TaxID=1931992 RepID=UPI0010F6DE8B|nr:DUF5667 domain-containing protein [Gandjariella thermophila]
MTGFRRRLGRSEQFARAVEALPEDGGSLDRHPVTPPPGPVDEVLAGELALVGLLRRAAATAGPDPEARGRIRQRVLDGLAERPPSRAPLPPTTACRQGRAGRASHGKHSSRRRPPSRDDAYARTRGRLLVALAAALCLVLSLGATSLLLSRDALPGDSLYWVKRTAETASLGLSFGDAAKGRRHLGFASSRLDEIQTMVTRDNASGAEQANRYLGVLADFEADSAAGARELAASGTNGDDTVLASLRDWANAQAQRLDAVRAELPALAATRSANSLALLDRIRDRVAVLLARTRCLTVTSGTSDDLGPLPAADPCTPRPTTAGVTSSAGPGGARSGAPAGSAGAPAAIPPAPAPAPSGGEHPPGNLLPLPGLSVPQPTAGGPATATPSTAPAPSVPIRVPPLPSLLPGLLGG